MKKERFSRFYDRVKTKKGKEKFFSMKKDPLTTRKDDYLEQHSGRTISSSSTKIKRQNESLLAIVNEMRFQRHVENEEQQNKPTFDIGDINNDVDQTNPEEQDVDQMDEPNVDVDPEQPEDPNRAGLIRRVDGAHLVYKRQASDGTYTELWVFHDNDFQSEMDVKRAILAGTDIDTSTGQSEDGSQRFDIWVAGNAQMIEITGLPN